MHSIALPLYSTVLDRRFLELTHLPWPRLSTHGTAAPRFPFSPALAVATLLAISTSLAILNTWCSWNHALLVLR